MPTRRRTCHAARVDLHKSANMRRPGHPHPCPSPKGEGTVWVSTDELASQQERGDARSLLNASYRRHPEPAGHTELAPSPLNRKAFARHVCERLARKAVTN